MPVRRLDIHVGKFDLADFFDLNAVANNSHSDFINWTVVNNGAWDYAADTRGYTYGGVIDYEDRWWGLQFAEALISKRANGLNLQKNLQDAHSENYELELRPSLIEKRSTTIRLLAFTNFANMGDYHEAIDLFEAGKRRSRKSRTIGCRTILSMDSASTPTRNSPTIFADSCAPDGTKASMNRSTTRK